MSQQMYTRKQFLSVFIKPTTTSPHMTAECAICVEPYSSSPDGCAVTFSDKESCNHVFCHICITQWLSTKGVNSCPLCRRELFVLDEEEFDDFDEEEDDEEDEDEDEDEERQPDVFFSYEQTMKILEDVWYRLFWLLGPYRRMVARRGGHVSSDVFGYDVRSDDDDEDDEDDDGFPLHSSILLHSFMDIVAARTDLHSLNDVTGFASGIKIDMLLCVLRRMLEEQVRYIESNAGREKVLEFPREKAVSWEIPMQWIMKLR